MRNTARREVDCESESCNCSVVARTDGIFNCGSSARCGFRDPAQSLRAVVLFDKQLRDGHDRAMWIEHRQSENSYGNALPLFVPQVKMLLGRLSVAQCECKRTTVARAQCAALRAAVHQQVIGATTPHHLLRVITGDALGCFVPVQNRSFRIDYIEPERKLICEASQYCGIVKGGSQGVPQLFSRQNEAGTSTLWRLQREAISDLSIRSAVRKRKWRGHA